MRHQKKKKTKKKSKIFVSGWALCVALLALFVSVAQNLGLYFRILCISLFGRRFAPGWRGSSEPLKLPPGLDHFVIGFTRACSSSNYHPESRLLVSKFRAHVGDVHFSEFWTKQDILSPEKELASRWWERWGVQETWVIWPPLTLLGVPDHPLYRDHTFDAPINWWERFTTRAVITAAQGAGTVAVNLAGYTKVKRFLTCGSMHTVPGLGQIILAPFDVFARAYSWASEERAALRRAGHQSPAPGFTDWELGLVLCNPPIRRATRFYNFHGGDVLGDPLSPQTLYEDFGVH